MFRPSLFPPGSMQPRTGLPGFSRLPPTGHIRPPPPSQGPNDEQMMKRSIDLTFGLIVVILNIAEIILISRIKRKKKIYEICILSLSVTDLLFGISNSVVSAIYLSKNGQNESILEITYTTYFYFVLNSILHLIWITFDRLWLVLKPLQHRAYVSRKRICIVLAATWITSTVIAASLYASDKVSDAFIKSHVTTSYVNATVTNITNDFKVQQHHQLTTKTEYQSYVYSLWLRSLSSLYHTHWSDLLQETFHYGGI
ncbi:octopamine receptor beta-2R-like [Hydractinia symbiolongicarpus]|uniref:octopamine receptor beta-2R-like n=1 Tax=Hydractinia symbiolongicarpus TaxID=13093 RepID=UPI00254A273A|nr:octopamine receptor beta-2R-like [Hydractinia symbiolongicarpus]